MPSRNRIAARCSVCHASCARVAPRSSRASKGKHNRHAHHKNKRGKHQVGRRQAVPVGVVHKVPRAAAAVVVHHDHERDGDAAQHIEREQPLQWALRCRAGFVIMLSWSPLAASFNPAIGMSSTRYAIRPSLAKCAGPYVASLHALNCYTPTFREFE